MTLELTYADSFSATNWKSPASGLWVASEAGTYLGMVERIEGRYAVSDATGRDLGSFAALGDAQQALDGVGDAPSSSARDVLMMKAIVAMTGITALALAASVILRWQ